MCAGDPRVAVCFVLEHEDYFEYFFLGTPKRFGDIVLAPSHRITTDLNLHVMTSSGACDGQHARLSRIASEDVDVGGETIMKHKSAYHGERNGFACDTAFFVYVELKLINIVQDSDNKLLAAELEEGATLGSEPSTFVGLKGGSSAAPAYSYFIVA